MNNDLSKIKDLLITNISKHARCQNLKNITIPLVIALTELILHAKAHNTYDNVVCKINLFKDQINGAFLNLPFDNIVIGLYLKVTSCDYIKIIDNILNTFKYNPNSNLYTFSGDARFCKKLIANINQLSQLMDITYPYNAHYNSLHGPKKDIVAVTVDTYRTIYALDIKCKKIITYGQTLTDKTAIIINIFNCEFTKLILLNALDTNYTSEANRRIKNINNASADLLDDLTALLIL